MTLHFRHPNGYTLPEVVLQLKRIEKPFYNMGLRQPHRQLAFRTEVLVVGAVGHD